MHEKVFPLLISHKKAVPEERSLYIVQSMGQLLYFCIMFAAFPFSVSLCTLWRV